MLLVSGLAVASSVNVFQLALRSHRSSLTMSAEARALEEDVVPFLGFHLTSL